MAQGLVFDIQRFSIHDGPGIRTTVFLKGCPLRCPWCQNPESLRPRAELAFTAERCSGSGHCFPACPRDALRRGATRIDRGRCDACGLCVAPCPFGALRVVGRRVGSDEIAEEALRDAPFYGPSGGGVTFSGGEPTLQMDFLAAAARRCKGKGISVGLQTCGMFAWKAFSPLLPDFDFIHYDLKILDPKTHRDMIGADNRPILSNARRLVRAGAPVFFRIPIVPGFTDGVANLDAVARFLKGLRIPRIQCLRYHAMGEGKLARLDSPLKPLGIGDGKRAAESLERAAGRLRAEDLEVIS